MQRQRDVSFGITIKNVREGLGLRQEDFGKLLGVVQSTVAFWEQGRPISDENLSKLRVFLTNHVPPSN